MTSSSHQSGSASSGAGPLDRIVHARVSAPLVEIVRYDRQGRWYREVVLGGKRERLKTVHDAVEAALAIEANGGEIFEGRPGGNRFDYMVAAGRRKAGNR